MPGAPVTLLHVETLGVVVPLAVAGEDLASAVRDAWRDALTGEASASGPLPVAPVLTVAVGERGQADVVALTVRQAVHALSTTVMRTAMAARSGELVMLDAVAVVDPATRAAAVLVELRGNRTVSATAFGDGLAHLASATTGITADGLVLPALDPVPASTGRAEDLAAPSALGLQPASDSACPLAALLVLQHDPGHCGEPRLEPLETIDALAALADAASGLHYLAEPLQRLADVVRRAGGARLVTFGDPATLAGVVRECLAGAAT
ncbi:hypothetical protein EXE58_10480 [Nocardioides seonyuensis]|uniref:Uncharacterized protein n=1 Tax=Nocardioides seonyuensis TaxID=2518371 RepID=A0A4V1BMC0_9ACTN|nr:hypothetical protein [Nocardioides seonyuensis]QBX55842.1 hypothetical protein EXE58_10480 [Nocardioides seonyuensis]